MRPTRAIPPGADRGRIWIRRLRAPEFRRPGQRSASRCASRSWRAVLCALLASLPLSSGAEGSLDSETVAIVHPSNPLQREISVRELRLLYGLYQRAWKGGTRVELVLPPSDSAEMRFVLERIVPKANASELSRYYLQAVFQNRLAEEPPLLGARESVAVVRSSPGALALVPRGEIHAADAVQVLEIRD